MKRILCTVAALMIAVSAFAGTAGTAKPAGSAGAAATEMTPQQAMEKTMQCPVCSAWGVDPALGPTIRYDIVPTKTGFIEVMQTANEAMKPSFDKAAAECEKRAAGIPTMSAADKAKLCPFCVAHMTLDRKDASYENASTALGMITVGTATTPEGIKVLHDYAAACKKQSDLIGQASMEMQQGQVQKAKM